MLVPRDLGWLVLGLACAVPVRAAAQATEPEPTFLAPAAGPDRSGGPAPTSEARAALREMEHELDAFGARADAYRRTVVELGRRELGHRRRDLELDYETRIGAERALETAARDRAIARMERFVADHPADASATPDAMLRLGELYAERSLATLGDDDAGPDYAPTIALYQQLLERFPTWARRGAALYVLGYCLDRQGRTEEAVAAWRRAVCSDGSSDYASCEPLEGDAALRAEMWLRVGGHEFDAPDPAANDRAIAAYSRALDGAAPRVRSLALYMLAWAHYRAGSYEAAIARFTDLVDAPHGSSALRAEAIDYVAIALADVDWNADSVDDREQGLPSPLARATDPTLIAQDRPWTVEILLALGRVAFDEGHYEDAAQVLEEAVRRWPLDYRIPAAIVSLARAYERMGDDERARATRERLAAYDVSSAWARHNEQAHAREVAEADRLARTFASLAVLGSAIQCHERAQASRAAGDDAAATTGYACAARGYRSYLATHTDDPDAYDVGLDLGDALFWSGDYEGAAHAYEEVRDSPLDDAHEADAARSAVEAYRRAIAAASIAIPEPPATPRIAPVSPLVAAMARARETYLARIDAAHDREHLRGVYAVNQAILLDHYGYTQHARARLAEVLARAGCGDDAAAAYQALRAIALRVNGDSAAAPELERLASDFATRDCATRESTSPASACDEDSCAADALCTARCDLTAIAYQRGLGTYHRAQAASGDESRHLYEQAATQLLAEIDRAPDHRDAPSALLIVGDALEHSGHDEAATGIYERAIEQLAPQHPADAERRAAVDRALAVSWLRLGRAAMRVFDDERAARAFGVLANGDRFTSSDDPTVVDARTNAWISLARIQERSAEYDGAAASYAHLASATTSTADEVRLATFEAAQMRLRAHAWQAAIREMTAFAQRWPDDADHVVRAYAEIAEAQRALRHRREEHAALEATREAYARVHGTPGSASAALAADAVLRLAGERAASFSTFAINPGAPATLDAYVHMLRAQLSTGATRAHDASTGYDDVAGYGHAPSTVAALVAQGEIDERLARGVLDAPFVMPRDLARALRHASPDVRAEAEAEIASRIATTLDEAVRPVECRAIARYVLAARVARRASVDDANAERGLDRLASYGEDRIAECVALEHARDASFTPYVPGEIARTPRGLDVAPTPGIAGPSLAAPR